jgi:hypothetical protein
MGVQGKAPTDQDAMNFTLKGATSMSLVTRIHGRRLFIHHVAI